MFDITRRLYKSKFVGASLLISVVTAAAYFCAYGFELGYLRSFGLPYQSVEVRTITFVLLFVGVGYLCLVLYSMVGSFSIMFGTKKTDRQTSLRAVVVTCGLLYLLTTWALSGDAFLIWAYIGISLTFVFSYMNYRADADSIYQALHITGMLAAVPLLFFFLALALGRLDATNEQTFKVYESPETKTAFVVVREYDDKIILAGIDGNRLNGTYRYILKTDRDLEFRVKNIHLQTPR